MTRMSEFDRVIGPLDVGARAVASLPLCSGALHPAGVRSLALILLTSACVVSSDADPKLERIELIGVDDGALLTPGDTVSLKVEGTELWRRALAIEVHRIDELGVDDIAAELPSTFDEAEERQTALLDWVIGGDFLATKGRSEIYFVARYREQSARSTSFFVEVDPQLVSVELVGLTAGAKVEAGAAIRVEVRGTEVWSQRVLLELMRRDTAISIAATATVTFDAASTSQTATHEWIVAGSFLERAGRSDLWVRATFGEQQFSTAEVFVQVTTMLTSIDVLLPAGTADPARAIPFPQPLTVLVRGSGMVGLPMTVELYRASPDALVESAQRLADANEIAVALEPGEQIYQPGEDSVPIYFRVTVGAANGSSSVFSLDRRGIAGCVWYLDGQELLHEADVDPGTQVEMRVFTWGYDGSAASFDIYENDDIGDDYLESLQGTVASDRVSPTWTARFVEDGVIDRRAEFFFRVTIENRDCQSARIHVER